MTRTESIHQERHATPSNAGGDLRSDRFPMSVCLLTILLSGSACSLGASGPAIGFKVGVQTLESPIDLNQTTRTRFELELSSGLFLNDRFDLAFAVGGSSLGTLSDRYADVVDGVLIEEFYRDELSLIDIRLAARFHPFGSHGAVRPHVGAGIGYFWFLDRWRYEYAETVPDPHFPGVFHTFIDEYRGTDTLGKGFFSFVTTGLTVPVGAHGELLFEFQYDFAKRDAGFDFGGPIYMIGARFRF
jgi:hypothetical protein